MCVHYLEDVTGYDLLMSTKHNALQAKEGLGRYSAVHRLILHKVRPSATILLRSKNNDN